MAHNTLPAKAKTQAGGAFTIKIDPSYSKHLVEVDVSATPASGSLGFKGRNQGTSQKTISGTIDMTGNSRTAIIEGVFTELEVTPTGYDAGKTYDVYVASW